MKELEMERLVDQHPHRAIRLIAARRDLFGRQGAVVATWRQRPHADQSAGCVKRTTSGRPRCVSGTQARRCPHPNPLRAPTEGWSGEGTSKCGPYYRLAYRDDGRQRSVYLGREGPLVDEVRRLLADLQRPLHRQRLMNRLCRQARAAVRVHKTRVDAQLRACGLRLQGFEVRGWRTSLLRGLTTPKPPTIRPLQPIRRPKNAFRGPRPIRLPTFPRCKPRSTTPAASDECLRQVVTARGDSS